MNSLLTSTRAGKIDALIKFLRQASPGIPPTPIIESVFAYELKYDLDALLRYFDWAKENGQSREIILETIMHDLGGIQKDPHRFSPRSASY